MLRSSQNNHRYPDDINYQALLSRLNTDARGLSPAEADKRRQLYGKNILRLHHHRTVLFMLVSEFLALFPVLLLVAAMLAMYADRLQPNQGFDLIATALFVVVVLNALVSFIQNYKVEKLMSSFLDYITRPVNVVRGGMAINMASVELVPGDLLIIQAGDKVSADAVILGCDDLLVDESILTGESLPVYKLPVTDNIAVNNRLYSGTTILKGEAKVLVTATGNNSKIGRIATLTRHVTRDLTPMQKELQNFVHKISLFSLVIGIVFFFIGYGIGNTFFTNLVFAIGIIVANVPEGLLPTVTLSLTQASLRMSKQHAVIKDIRSVETLGSTTVICTDKTGTLTRNQLHIEKLFIDLKEESGINSNLMRNKSLDMANIIMALCNSAVLTTNEQNKPYLTGDPIEVAMAEFVQQHTSYVDLRKQYRLLHTLPFDAHRRTMAVSCQTPGGAMLLLVKGAAEVVIEKCSKLYTEGFERTLHSQETIRLLKQASEYATSGLRVLALAYRSVEDPEAIPEDMVFVGLVALTDPPRPEVPAAVSACQTAGIRIIVMSGDKEETVAYITRKLGIADKPQVISGEQLEAMSHASLVLALQSGNVAFARIAPEQKLAIVEALKDMGEVVAMTGDGVNDAPALKRADIGVAMGLKGTDVAREAADIILLDDNFATIVKAIEEGRAVYDNIKKFINYVLASNVPEILPYIAYVLFPIPLPITVVQILSIDLMTDMLPAIGLGNEKPEHDIMQRPPRARTERLVNYKTFVHSYAFIGLLEAVLAFCMFFLVLYDNNWYYGDRMSADSEVYRQAAGAFLITIIFCQIGNVMACRGLRQSAINYLFRFNGWIMAGIILELLFIGLITLTPGLYGVFTTAPIAVEYWPLFVLASLLVFTADELRKWILSRRFTIFQM
ncbi:MAG: cation-transporting P-type ATPase [Gammaproteobacteria bacterium]|nr:cation-transporting P-type ATPase [Gammaproteobacteria bacterium]